MKHPIAVPDLINIANDLQRRKAEGETLPGVVWVEDSNSA